MDIAAALPGGSVQIWRAEFYIPCGNPAISSRPVAFRPCLTTGLAFQYKGISVFILAIFIPEETGDKDVRTCSITTWIKEQNESVNDKKTETGRKKTGDLNQWLSNRVI